MPELANMADDLAFVRKRVDQVNQSVFPSSILFLWAGLVLVGYVLMDVAPLVGSVFWLIAGPVGGVISAFLGWRWSIALGVEDMENARRQGLHWGGLLAALVVTQLLAMGGAISGDAFGGQVLLLVAMAYYYAGIHMHKSLLWLSGIQALVFVATALIPSLPATVSGLVLASGFVWLGIVARRHLATTLQPDTA